MNWNKHSKFEGAHAFLSASKFHWINYTNEKLVETYQKQQLAMKGPELHEFAAMAIRLGIKQQNTDDTLNMYINDAIRLNMDTEVLLFYSDNCFGTADAILFNPENNTLHIHDLKTGSTPAHMEQLFIYAALFCLEYGFNPYELTIMLKMYQSNEVLKKTAEPEQIDYIMDKIKSSDKILSKLKGG